MGLPELARMSRDSNCISKGLVVVNSCFLVRLGSPLRKVEG